MENYYKILGVKKDASEEEIRGRWVKLMRKLHPDQRIEGASDDERIKEINEAYQVLKHSSTRVEYDLKRAYDRRKRNSYLRRLSIIPIAIFVVFVMIGTIYLRRSQVTLQANLPTRDRVNPMDQTNQTDQINQIDEINRINRINQINQTDPINSTNPVNAIDPSALSHIPPVTLKRIDASTHERFDSSTRPPKRSNVPNDPNVLNVSLPTKLPNDPIIQTNQISQIDKIDQINQINQTDPINPTTQLTPPPTVASAHEPVSASSHPRIDAFTPLPATEEEVRRFFADYTERYAQMDLGSFISLFSSRAIQNRQDGLEGIRKIYDNFLKQSQEIKYNIDHLEIEIDRNGVEAKARYELVQMTKKSGDKRIWRGDIRWSLMKEDGVLKILSLDFQHQKSP